MGPNPIWLVFLQEKDIIHKETPGWPTQRKKSHEVAARKMLSANQGERYQKKNQTYQHFVLDFIVKNSEEIDFCRLSHPVFGILLWQF